MGPFKAASGPLTPLARPPKGGHRRVVGSHRGEAGMAFGSSRRPIPEIGFGRRGERHAKPTSLAHLTLATAKRPLGHHHDRHRVVASHQTVDRDTKVAQYRTVYRHMFCNEPAVS